MPESKAYDKRRIHRNFERAAPEYDSANPLSGEVCSRMLERLDLVRVVPARILDFGCGTGVVSRALARRYPRAQIAALDFCLPELQLQRRGGFLARARELVRGRSPLSCVCADFERLPVASGVIDFVVSNLALHWCDAPQLVVAELQRVLRAGGLLMFTTLGPDTLKELAQASLDGDGRSPVHTFPDMHDLGDMLIRGGFADPVMDMEHITLTYLDLDDLFRDLRASGGMSARVGRAGLRTPRWRRRLAQRYESFRRDGRLPATFEIVYGHAWKPEGEKRGPDTAPDGRAIIRFKRP